MKGKEVYILSTGRSGSTFLSKVFMNKCLEQNIEHQKSGSRIINIISNIPGTPSLLLTRLLKIFNRGYPPVSTADPLLSIAILRLIEAGKIDGKIIHLVRDPRTFVESFMNWKTQSLRKQFLHHFVPFWNPVPYLSDSSIGFFQWLKMSKFEKFCWVWNYKNCLFNNLRKNSEDFLLVRLEDITSSDKEKRENEFEKISNFLSVTLTTSSFNIRSKVNPSKKIFFPPYVEWAENQRSILKKHCGELAKEFGYQLD